MKNKYILKELAESNHVFGTHLTKEQIRKIRNTEYSSLLRDDVEKTKFEKLCENATEYTEKKEPKKRKASGLYLAVNKDYIINMTHELEDYYNMGLSNNSSSVYDVDPDRIKKHIREYMDKNKLNNSTREELIKIIYHDKTTHDILIHLYSICSSASY